MEEIDLNSQTYDLKPLASRELILESIDDYQIFRHYLGDFPLRKAFNSPLRKDSIPSFNVFYGSNNGKLMYKDFATGEKGDCFNLVQHLFGFIKYFDAIRKICTDFQLNHLEYQPIGNIPTVVNIPEQKDYDKNTSLVEISIKRRSWSLGDKEYWSSYGVHKKTLEAFNVSPISYVFFNGNIQKCDSLAYAYKEFKDGRVSFKIYQPNRQRNQGKFINNADWKVHQGYSMLPDTGQLLVITKSLKDVMTLYELGYPSIAPQAESIPINDPVMHEYKERFEKVVLLYDDDPAGRVNTEKLSEQYDLDYFFITEANENVKDVSDMRRYKGQAYTESYLNTILIP